MNLQKAKVLLKKINALNDSLSPDDGPITSIEKDLMLSYVRQLYEAYLDNAAGSNVSSADRNASKTKAAGSGPELEIASTTKERTAAPEPVKRKYTPPRIIEIPDTPPEKTKESNPAPPAPKPATPAYSPQTVQTNNTGSSDPRVKALFDQQTSNELSEKLSLQPLKDLTKGLSINDRLLYTNDLFDKDANVFNAALKKLNEMNTLDQAKSFLEEQATRYHWTDGEKADIAKDFIKHVRRRYV